MNRKDEDKIEIGGIVIDGKLMFVILTDMIRSSLKEAGFPKIVCLCGSTKFKDKFIKANFDYTMKGCIVLSVGWFSHSDRDVYYPTPDEKIKLDELHKRKIELADEVVVIHEDGYIGESTKSEIEYAGKIGKTVIMYEVENE